MATNTERQKLHRRIRQLHRTLATEQSKPHRAQLHEARVLLNYVMVRA